MARKRMIDPEFWSDEEIGRWSFAARLFYIGLWNFADDEGRFKAHNDLLKAQIFPYDKEIDIDKLKKELNHKIQWYEIEGLQYGFIRNFLKHQRIDRPTESKLPAPPASIVDKSTSNPRGVLPNIREVNISKDNKEKKIIFNHSTSNWENITEEDKKTWQETYPACDINIELKRMQEWIKGAKQKGYKKNWYRFITNWLSRAQDKGGTKTEKEKRPFEGSKSITILTEEMIYKALGKIATKDMIKNFLRDLPQSLWIRVANFLHRTYPGDGDRAYILAEKELLEEIRQIKEKINPLIEKIGK